MKGKGKSGRKEQVRRAVNLLPKAKRFPRWMSIMRRSINRHKQEAAK